MLRFRWLPLVLGPILATFLSVAPAEGSVVEGLELDELVAEADRIVLGHVLLSESFLRSNGQIWTWHRIGVERAIRGSAAAQDEVIVETMGGQIGEIGMRVEGEATFQVGERVLLFVHGGGAYKAFRTVGMGQGVMRIRRENGAETVRQSREGLMLLRRDAEGRLKRSFGAVPEPQRLDAFLSTLRKIAAQQEAGR